MKTLEFMRTVMFLLGIVEDGRFIGLANILYKFITKSFCMLFFVYASLFTPSAYIARFDSGLFAQYASIMFYGSMTMLEFAYVIYKQKDLLRILNHIEHGFVDFNNDGAAMKEKCRKQEMSFLKKVVLLQSPVFVGSISVFLFKESSSDDVKWNIHLGKTHPERTIPYMVWIPYDETGSPYYEIALCTVYVCLLLCALIMHLLITLTPILTIYICGQFKIICNALENLKPVDDLSINSFESANEDAERSLIGAINAHQNVLRFSNEVIHFCRPLILLKVIFFFGILSVLLFAVSTVPFGSKVYFQSLFCSVGFTFELFLLCFYGEYLTTESRKVATATYHSVWYKLPKKMKNALQFVMLRSQTPTQFNVHSDFIIACLKTYIQVVQASFSYFTVLRKIHDKSTL